MDEAFMSRVAERIAVATEAVSSFSPTVDPNKLPAVQTMDEWMASHSPATKHRCGDCKAPLVEGSTKICVACGRHLPPRFAVKREQFSFHMSLAKKLFYESVNLEDPQDTSTDIIEDMPLHSSGTNPFSDQQLRSATGFGVEEVERNVEGDEGGNAIVSDPGENIAPAAPGSKPLKVEEESEEYIWESAEADDFGSQSWAQQLARDTGGDPKEVSPATNSTAFYPAKNAFGQTSPTSAEDFFAIAAISGDQSQSQSVETDFRFFFPPVSNAVEQSRIEPANTAGPSSSSKDSPSLGTDFHDFFQNSVPIEPTGQTYDPSVPEGSTGQTVEGNSDDFFHSAPASTDESHRQSEGTITRLSGDQFNTHIETDFDDFFQGLPKAADHSHGADVGSPAPHTAEESSSHNINMDFDGFFQAVPESSGQSGGQNVETHILHAAEESSGRVGEFETDFDDFLQAAPKSADQSSGSTEETPIPHPAGDFSGQREEPDFDFFFQTTPVTANQSRGQDVEAAASHGPERPISQNLDTDFSFFFQGGPVSGGQSHNKNGETDARDLAKESSGQKDDNHFEGFFEASHKPADRSHRHNLETPVSISSEGNNTQRFQMDFNDFFQAAPVVAGPSPGQNVNGAEPNPVEGPGAQYIETDFFAGAPKRPNGLDGHNAGTDFDFFFQTPSKSKDRLPYRHTQSDGPDNLEKSNGHGMEPGFDDFFPSANNSINFSHGQNVKTVVPKPAEESPGQIVETDFDDFFQGAPCSMDKSNGHSAVGHFDFLQSAPHGQKVLVGFDDFFSTDRQSVDKFLGKNESERDFDPFHQAVPSSIDKSLDQNGTTDFDDFVQAAPQSADEVVGQSQTTQFCSFFQERPPSGNNPQQSLTTDFDDFFQAAAQTADKPPKVITGLQVDIFENLHRPADRAHHRKESMDFGSLFQVAPPNSSSGSSAYGNGSGQTAEAGASAISAMTQSWSSNGDILSQLEGLHVPQDPLQGYQEPKKKMPNDLSDLSFRLADHLVISDEAATNMWSFN